MTVSSLTQEDARNLAPQLADLFSLCLDYRAQLTEVLPHSLIHCLGHSLTHLHTHSLAHSLTHSLSHALTRLHTCSFHLLVHSHSALIHSAIHSRTHPAHSLTHPAHSLVCSLTFSTHSLSHTLTHPPCSLTHSLTLLIHLLAHSLTQPCTHPPTHSTIYLLAHSPTLKVPMEDVEEVEKNCVLAFTQLVVHLSESVFRPIFLKVHIHTMHSN